MPPELAECILPIVLQQACVTEYCTQNKENISKYCHDCFEAHKDQKNAFFSKCDEGHMNDMKVFQVVL